MIEIRKSDVVFVVLALLDTAITFGTFSYFGYEVNSVIKALLVIMWVVVVGCVFSGRKCRGFNV